MTDIRVYTASEDLRQGFIVGRLRREIDHLAPDGEPITRCGIRWFDMTQPDDGHRRLCKRCERVAHDTEEAQA